MATSEPLEHVVRSLIPWRLDEEGKTECGKRVIDVAATITLDQLIAKVKSQGRQRAAMSTCMTCLERARYARRWEVCPSDVMGREVQNSHGWNRDTHIDDLLDKELRALAALVEAHRDEFDGYLAGLESTVSLADARANRKPKTIVGRIEPRPL